MQLWSGQIITSGHHHAGSEPHREQISAGRDCRRSRKERGGGGGGSLFHIYSVAGVVGLGGHYDALELVSPMHLRWKVALARHERVSHFCRPLKGDNDLSSHLQHDSCFEEC